VLQVLAGRQLHIPVTAAAVEAAGYDVHELSFVRQSWGTRPFGPGTG
jgi:hypothetical protein